LRPRCDSHAPNEFRLRGGGSLHFEQRFDLPKTAKVAAQMETQIGSDTGA